MLPKGKVCLCLTQLTAYERAVQMGKRLRELRPRGMCELSLKFQAGCLQYGTSVVNTHCLVQFKTSLTGKIKSMLCETLQYSVHKMKQPGVLQNETHPVLAEAAEKQRREPATHAHQSHGQAEHSGRA